MTLNFLIKQKYEKMKKIIISLTMLTVLISLTECDDSFLQQVPQNGTTSEGLFFKKKADFDGLAFGAYHELNGYVWDTGVGSWAIVSGSILRDITQLDETPRILTDYITPTAGFVSSSWQINYKIVSRANELLNQVSKVSKGILTDPEVESLTGEAKFLRGFGYLGLAQRFGSVPLYLKAFDVADTETPKQGCAPEAEVWNQVILDLTDAAAKLPKDWDAANLGRATTGSALAFLANAYMYKKDWANAKKASDDLIALGKYALHPNVRELFSIKKENTIESIFEVQFGYQKGGTINWNPDTPDYGNALGFITSPKGVGNDYANNSGTGEAPMRKKLADAFDPNDLRRKFLVLAPGEMYVAEGFKAPKDTLILSTDPAKIPQQNSAFSTKYWIGPDFDPSDGSQRWFGAQNNPLFRYAEFLLNYAEILFELGDINGAYTQLNLVRVRAGVPARTAQANRDVFFADLMLERRFELNFEPQLVFHFMRTGYLKTHLENDGVTFDPKWLKFPIPSSETDLNANLCQNAGY
ncbi:RagB/SusD family nutrient uptake outer membrane protein [soil metagenome]